MTLIDFGDFKLRFDPKEVRINIDGEMIDIGARTVIDDKELPILYNRDIAQQYVIYHKDSGERIFLGELMKKVRTQ